MAFCFMIGIAGGVDSDKSLLTDAFCEAYSHKTVIRMNMEDYRKKEEDRPLVTLDNGVQFRDKYSPKCYDFVRMRNDIVDIMYNEKCRILVVEGSLILYDKSIEELCDARVYIDGPLDSECSQDITPVLSENAFIRYCHKQYIVPSKAETDIPVTMEDGVDRGLWKIKKALWGLWL